MCNYTSKVNLQRKLFTIFMLGKCQLVLDTCG